MTNEAFSIGFAVIVVVCFLGLVIYALISAYRKKQAEKKIFDEWIISSGYAPQTSSVGLSLSSFNDGQIVYGFSGVLKDAQNVFSAYLQSETRGSGKNRRVYSRTIFEVNIPDTQLQMIVNSKINNDGLSGGNLAVFSKEQRFMLEGDFGDFFDVYMPNQTQSETLTILAPNSMLFILKELAAYDIEINGSKLYLYNYSHLKKSDFEALIPRVEALLKELRLRKGDIGTEKITNALVARTATDASSAHRGLKKNSQYLAILFFLFIFLAQFSDHPIVLIPVALMVVYFFITTVIGSIRQSRLKSKYNSIIKHY